MRTPQQNPNINTQNLSGVETPFGQLVNVSGLITKIKEAAAGNFGLENTLNILGAIDLKAMEVAKSFGVGGEQALEITKALVSARDDVFALGGDWDDLVKTQVDASNALGRNVTLGAEAQRELFAAYKVTGVEVGTMVGKLKDVGISAYDAGDAMFKVVKAANDTGVSAKNVSKLVTENISFMNQYNFKDGVEGLARMAAQATAMRIDMKDIMNAAQKAFEPDGAIRMAAELQRLGVTQSELLDPLSLMNMAENDPAELQNQIAEMSKQFVQLNKDGQFEIMPGAKRQMMAIEKSLGLSTGSLSKMALASAETEEKMKRIQFPEFMTEEQKKTLANLTEMKDGKMMIEIDGEMKSIEDALRDAQAQGQEGIDKLLKKTEKKSIEDMAESQLSASEKIAANTNVMAEMLPAALATSPDMQRILREIAEGSTRVRQGAQRGVGGGTSGLAAKVTRLIAGMKQGGQSLSANQISQLMGSLRTQFQDVFGQQNFQTQMTNLQNLITGQADTTTLLSDISNFFNSVTPVRDAIISPKMGTFKTLPEDDIYVGTGLSDMFNKMSELKTEVPKMTEGTVPNLANLKTQETKITSEVKEIGKEIKIDLNINVTAPPQIDTNEITKVLKDQLVIQQIIQKIEQVSTNNNLSRAPK